MRRKSGRLFDVHKVENADLANSRAGSNQMELQKGDLLLKIAYSGDCFCDYYVCRVTESGKPYYEGEWCGYDGFGPVVGHVELDRHMLSVVAFEAAYERVTL